MNLGSPEHDNFLGVFNDVKATFDSLEKCPTNAEGTHGVLRYEGKEYFYQVDWKKDKQVLVTLRQTYRLTCDRCELSFYPEYPPSSGLVNCECGRLLRKES